MGKRDQLGAAVNDSFTGQLRDGCYKSCASELPEERDKEKKKQWRREGVN